MLLQGLGVVLGHCNLVGDGLLARLIVRLANRVRIQEEHRELMCHSHIGSRLSLVALRRILDELELVHLVKCFHDNGHRNLEQVVQITKKLFVDECQDLLVVLIEDGLGAGILEKNLGDLASIILYYESPRAEADEVVHAHADS